MYKTKILTHVIRLSDGHVMPDWINIKMTGTKGHLEAEKVKSAIRNGEYDTDNHAIRMRRYPFARHETDVELWPESKFIGSPRRMW